MPTSGPHEGCAQSSSVWKSMVSLTEQRCNMQHDPRFDQASIHFPERRRTLSTVELQYA